jgi:hypothetical protein
MREMLLLSIVLLVAAGLSLAPASARAEEVS